MCRVCLKHFLGFSILTVRTDACEANSHGEWPSTTHDFLVSTTGVLCLRHVIMGEGSERGREPK